jgi:hypothetical protein
MTMGKDAYWIFSVLGFMVWVAAGLVALAVVGGAGYGLYRLVKLLAAMAGG